MLFNWDAVLDSEPAPYHPVVFERLTGDTIRHATLHYQGAAGPSGLDANCWRRLCTMFHGASRQLCEALATATRRLYTSYVDPTIIRPFIACHLIPLSKNPGVRPFAVHSAENHGQGHSQCDGSEDPSCRRELPVMCTATFRMRGSCTCYKGAVQQRAGGRLAAGCAQCFQFTQPGSDALEHSKDLSIFSGSSYKHVQE